MPDPSQRQRLLAVARQAVRRHELHGRSLPDLETKPPTPGDVLRLARTAPYGVEWVLLAREDLPEAGFRVLPADAGDLVGAADLEIPEGGGTGTRVVRCRCSLHLPLRQLAGGRRVDVIAADDLEGIRAVYGTLGEAGFRGSILGREEEATTAYLEWFEEVVQPALKALRDRGAEPGTDEVGPGEPSEAPDPPPPAPFPPPRLPGRTSRRWPLAAAVLLPLLGLGSYAGWLQLQVLRLAGIEESVEERVRAARQDLEAEHARELARVAEEGDRIRRVQAEELAAAQLETSRLEGSVRRLEESLSAAEEGSFLVSPMLAAIADLRGEADVRTDPRSSHLLIIFQDPDRLPALGSRLRATLRRPGDARALKVLSGLELSAQGTLFIGYPRSLLPPGEYSLVLEIDEGGGYRPYRTLELEVLREDG